MPLRTLSLVRFSSYLLPLRLFSHISMMMKVSILIQRKPCYGLRGSNIWFQLRQSAYQLARMSHPALDGKIEASTGLLSVEMMQRTGQRHSPASQKLWPNSMEVT